MLCRHNYSEFDQVNNSHDITNIQNTNHYPVEFLLVLLLPMFYEKQKLVNVDMTQSQKVRIWYILQFSHSMIYIPAHYFKWSASTIPLEISFT